ncbi:MAG: hypothetical protein ACRDP5_17705 [Streptosporangiaceae bacterium]
MSDNQDTWYEITLDTDHLKSYRVRAAYLTVDERLFPGWTLLKNEHSVLVAMLRSERALLIQRCDETAGVPAVKPSPGPSPATVAPFRPPAVTASSVAYTTSSPRT